MTFFFLNIFFSYDIFCFFLPFSIDFVRQTPTTNVEEKSSFKLTPPPLPELPPPSIHRRHRNFRALSANVQRLISHSNTSLHPDDMNDNHSITEDQNLNSLRKRLLSSQLAIPTTNGCKFKHPLSKNTCKLTQSGNDLVIDDSDGGYSTPPEIPYANQDNLYDLVNANIHEYSDPEDNVDKTPINECPPFDFNIKQNDINANDTDDVYEEVEVANDHKENWTTNENNNTRNEEETSLISLKNPSFIHSVANNNKCEHVSIDSSQCASAQNSPTLSQKSSSDCSDTKSTKSQLFAIKAQVIEQSTKQIQQQQQKHSPISDSSGIDTMANAENDSSATVNDVSQPKENGQFTIDLKRTKIRPLSSVSISSTSSSSSSASDEHSSNQNTISYLASVESLADHSENELAIISPSLTVTERACLEIIDSERSYVDDLGQVIRG